jgi:hypothetical protein
MSGFMMHDIMKKQGGTAHDAGNGPRQEASICSSLGVMVKDTTPGAFFEEVHSL